MQGMLVIISGPSGSGKGTVVKRLDPSHGYALSVSVTTRAPRAGEREGVDYFFRTEDEFTRMRQHNELLEHAVYVGNYYGTPRQYVEEMIAKGKVVVLEIEVVGALQVKEKFPEAVLVFLMPPTISELARRLQCRNTEDRLTIEDRLRRAREEIALIPRYQYLVVNDEISEAVGRINAIVEAERLRPQRCADEIEFFSGN
ncbi:MAG: guanylate kinase [Clostridiales bacterium]|jgi:guanylate kinase|nr:guanylate kinase [Clostridiales bacterium]